MVMRFYSRARARLAGSGTALLVAAAVLAAPAGGAAAEPVSINPFDALGGFTVLAQGDAVLNSSEIEGSIAVFGSVRSGNQNGFPMVHEVAGVGDYTLPTVDGRAVRILAGSFVGPGAFDVSNRAARTDADLNAGVKLVDVTGLVGSARGGGVGAAAGKDFLRVTNPAGGVLDLKAYPYATSSVADLATAQPSVASYLPDLASAVARTDTCLDAMAGDATLANRVTVQTQGEMVFVSGFSTTMPNVVDYSELANRTIKLDRAGGYVPTAQAPLVVRVAPGTTTVGRLGFEGWSAGAGQQQAYARSILLDASQVTGTLTIDGFEMGGVWAPHADLVFSSNITTNGQWIAQNVTTSGAGEIHHHTFAGRLLCGVEESTEPGDGTDPGETTEPGDGTDPGDATHPGEDTDSVDPGDEVQSPAEETSTSEIDGAVAGATHGPSAEHERAPVGTGVAGALLAGTGLDAPAAAALLAVALLLTGAALLAVRRRRAMR